MRLSAPAPFASTTPLLANSVRHPKDDTECVSCSQSATSPARNPRPGGDVSSRTRSFEEHPYRPMALPWTRSAGGAFAIRIAVTRLRVGRIRLDRSTSFREVLHRLPSSGAPVRLTTTDAPSSSYAHWAIVPSASQVTIRGEDDPPAVR